MAGAGHLDQIWRYPAKSMLGEPLDRAELLAGGIPGDRGWAVRDEVRGGIRGAKKIPGLMRLAARYLTEPESGAPPPPIEIRLPDGRITASNRDDVDATLSDALGHPVTLWPLQPATDLDHYRRGAPDSDDLLTELRDIFGRVDDEPLPDVSWMPPEIFEFESPLGTYFDVSPVHILTTASLAALAGLAAESAVDVRRFRPNLVIDTAEESGWVEQSWIGRSVRIGTAVLDIVGPCPRCVMTTRPVGDLPADTMVLRRIVRDADQNLGVYATIRTPGVIANGDEVRVQ